MEPATPLRRLGALLLDGLLCFLTLVVGYIIWWLIVLRRGQTPGKRCWASGQYVVMGTQPAGD